MAIPARPRSGVEIVDGVVEDGIEMFTRVGEHLLVNQERRRNDCLESIHADVGHGVLPVHCLFGIRARRSRKVPRQGSSPLTEGKITNWGRFGIHFGEEFAFEGCSRAGSGMKPGRVIPTGRFSAIGLSGNSFGLGERAAIQRRLTRDRIQAQNCGPVMGPIELAGTAIYIGTIA